MTKIKNNGNHTNGCAPKRHGHLLVCAPWARFNGCKSRTRLGNEYFLYDYLKLRLGSLENKDGVIKELLQFGEYYRNID